MDAVVIGLVMLVVGFVLGVVFGKYVVSEARQIKEHVTEEVAATEGRLRSEIADVRSKIASKL